ncbi:MAG TPA: hypothetical protein VFQ02_09175 [Nitrospira sp.]|nr:hypothetical protein [Nitrospira sp.]
MRQGWQARRETIAVAVLQLLDLLTFVDSIPWFLLASSFIFLHS